MVSLEEVIKKRKKKKTNRKKPMTKDQLTKQVIEWTDFYRKNWDIYAVEELGLTLLHTFQVYIIYLMGVSDYFFLMCGRGVGKSFMTSIGAFIKCMLYPNSTVVITATTKATATKMVKEKMEKELCNTFSKKLKYLYDNKQIVFKYSDEEISVNFLFNKSKILVLPEVEASVGTRATTIIFEEFRLSKQDIVKRIFMPMRYSRPAVYKEKEEYKNDKRLTERASVIYLTSTSYMFEPWFQQWVHVVNGFFNEKSKLRYGIFCGDIRTSIDHGFTTEEEFEAILNDPTDSEERINMEYYNQPQGSDSNSFYNMEKFKENSVIEEGFVPPTYYEYVFKYNRGEEKWFRDKQKEEIRVIYVDFSSSDTIKKGQENDKTVIGCMSGYPNKDRSRMIRNVEYIEACEGGDKTTIEKRIRELFYFYDADVFVYDNLNMGQDRYLDLSKPYYHEELGIQMSGFGIYQDESITSKFCDVSKTRNLSSQVVDRSARGVSIPVVGSPERNHNFHHAMKNAVKSDNIRFLTDVITTKRRLANDKDWMNYTPDEKARYMIGHIQVEKMVKEACELISSIIKGYIHLHEINHHEKDRIMATIYGNYFFTQLELKMLREDQVDDLNESDFYDIYNVNKSKVVNCNNKVKSLEDEWTNAFL